MDAFGPTPKNEWVKPGDKCQCRPNGIVGTVLSVHMSHSIPYARVEWPTPILNPPVSIGRHTITTLRKVQ